MAVTLLPRCQQGSAYAEAVGLEVAVALAGVGDGLQVDVFTDQGDFVLGEQRWRLGCEGAVLGASG